VAPNAAVDAEVDEDDDEDKDAAVVSTAVGGNGGTGSWTFGGRKQDELVQAVLEVALRASADAVL
jgi:hypothetical protein